MYAEDELLPISALQHLLFCERQCALIHVEGEWAENRLTVEGRHLHERVHDEGAETRGDARLHRGVLLRSLHLGLYGKADLVEITGSPGQLKALPVEYKRGRPKTGDCDRVQLCAQAICLEEMLGVPVREGALFYGRTRRREIVPMTGFLRTETEQTAARLHQLVQTAHIPPADCKPRCKRCSLRDICLPQATGPSRSAKRFLARNAVAGAGPPEDDTDP